MRVVTKRSIEVDRKYTVSKIEDLKKKLDEITNSINKCENRLEELDALEEELEEYEKRPISEKTMVASVYKDTGTVALMDRFESCNEKGFKKYSRLIINNKYKYNTEYGYYLVVERRLSQDVVGGITMTDFKQGYTSRVREHAQCEITNYIDNIGEPLHNGQIIEFKTCYLLRAQNSSNRTGYGNIYNGEKLVLEGTLYGETTSYVFAGVQIVDEKVYEEEQRARLEKYRQERIERLKLGPILPKKTKYVF